MTFSAAWEEFHAKKIWDGGAYPHFEKLMVTFVQDFGRVLELGTGFGQNVPFFDAVNADYHGIDGSSSAVKVLREQFPHRAAKVMCADFTREIPFERGFDVIVDRASISHNDVAGIERCIALVHDYLKPGGLFIGADWFSTGHSEYLRGTRLDTSTRTGYEEGQFADVGKVHFTDEAEMAYLFRHFDGLHLEERITRRPAPNDLVRGVIPFRWISRDFDGREYRSAMWDVVVRKPV